MGCIGSVPFRVSDKPSQIADTPTPRRPTIDAPLAAAAHTFTESYAAIEPVLLHAMSWANERGVSAVRPGAGAALRLLASTTRAKSVVEIGTGTGVSGLWLLRGMRPDSVLTSIDVEPEHQAMAKQSFAAAGFASSRTRLIAGNSRDVLPRLADGAYDLVFVDSIVSEYAHCVSAAHRLLRPGALLVVNNALGADNGVVDPEAHDQDTLTTRELLAYFRDSPEWTATLLAAGPGLLCATKDAGSAEC
jgi:predicted O-methyltransferase YrrM